MSRIDVTTYRKRTDIQTTLIEVINEYITLLILDRSNIAGFIVDSMKIRVFTELDQINTGSYKYLDQTINNLIWNNN